MRKKDDDWDGVYYQITWLFGTIFYYKPFYFIMLTVEICLHSTHICVLVSAWIYVNNTQKANIFLDILEGFQAKFLVLGPFASKALNLNGGQVENIRQVCALHEQTRQILSTREEQWHINLMLIP